MEPNACNNFGAVSFVFKFQRDCEIIAKELTVPVENILGLAAAESAYGTGRIASEYNNYFSLQAPAPLQIRAEPAKLDPEVKMAVFSSFSQGSRSFAIKWGSSVRGISAPKAFSEALVRAGYNSGNSNNGGCAGYADNLAAVIGMVKARMRCSAK
jgi:hypothetical protein